MRTFSMSMMLCIIIISSAFLASCSKDETSDSSNPITALVFPASDADSPIYTGDLVQIGGKGFAANCEIWLQGADGKEVKAPITVNSDGVSFIAPSILGKYSAELEQGGEVYVLGELFFAERQGESHLFVWDYDVKAKNSSLYEYDKNKGTFNPFATMKSDFWKVVLPGKNGLIYYFYEEECLYSYDLKTKKETQILRSGWLAKTEAGGAGRAVGLINDKLHGVKYSREDGFTLVAIAGDGKETIVEKFKALPAPDGKGVGNFWADDDNLIFTYDEINQVVFLSGANETADDTFATLVALNLKTGKVEALMDKKIDWYQCLNVNGKIWIFTEMDKVNDQVVSQINPLTLKTEQTINELSGNDIEYPVYSKAENIIYWDGSTADMRAVTSYNVQTKKIATVSKTSFEIEGMFVATY